jgi:hypothetical protein
MGGRKAFLYPNERVVRVGTVLKRKGFFSKKRVLVLTDKPRLMYVDEKKMTQKGEIPITLDVNVELRGGRQFFVHVVRFGRLIFVPRLMFDEFTYEYRRFDF